MSAPVVALTSSTWGAIISPSFFSPVVTSTSRRAGGTRRRDRRARPGVVPERSAAASAAAITAHAIWQPFGETRSGPARSGGRQSAAPCARTRASRSLWQSEPGSSTSLPYRKFRSVTASPPAGGLWEQCYLRVFSDRVISIYTVLLHCPWVFLPLPSPSARCATKTRDKRGGTKQDAHGQPQG